MAADFDIKQGDLGPSLEFTCQDATGAAVLIQSYPVRFIMRSQKTGIVKVSADAQNLDDGTANNRGKGRYDWQAGDTDTAGLYDCEVQVTFPGSKPQTFPNGGYKTVRVWDDLG